MKKVAFALLILAGVLNIQCSNTKPVKAGDLKTFNDSISYIIGTDVGKNFRRQELEINTDIFYRAFHAVYGGDTSMFDQQTLQMVMQKFQQIMMKKGQEKQAEAAAEQARKGAENKAKGEEFLNANKAKEGVQSTESGLQYKVNTPGEGKKPNKDSRVKVHYHGTLIDGTVFDSSVERGEPATFGVSQVIKGWTEALQLMKVGAKWTLYIPAELAYGAQGGGSIGPNETLIFEVELLGIEK